MEKIVYKKIHRRDGWGYAVVNVDILNDDLVYGVGMSERAAWADAYRSIDHTRGIRIRDQYRIVRATPMATEYLILWGCLDGNIDIVRFDELTTADLIYQCDEKGKSYMYYDYVVDIRKYHEDEAAELLNRYRNREAVAV